MRLITLQPFGTGNNNNKRFQETILEEDEESLDQGTFPISVIPASPDLSKYSIVSSGDPDDISFVGSELQGDILENSDTSRVIRGASDGNKISDQSSQLRYNGFKPCKESTMISKSRRPHIPHINSSKSKCKSTRKENINPEESKKRKNPMPVYGEVECSEREPDLRQKRRCLLDTTYFMDVTNRKQLDPPNKTLQMSTVDLFEDIDPEPRKFHN